MNRALIKKLALPIAIILVVTGLMALVLPLEYSLITLAVATAILYSVTYVVPEYEYDAPSVLGIVLPTRKSGPHFRLPLITRHRFQSTKDFKEEDTITYLASDDVQVTHKLDILLSADPDVDIQHGDLEGTNRFVQVEREELVPGLRNLIAVDIVTVGAQHPSETAKHNLAQLNLLANCKVRLERMPHHEHDPSDCGVPGCSLPAGRIPLEKVIEYYKVHEEEVRRLLSSEDASTSRSEAETIFGCDIKLATINEPSFTKEFVEANEARRRAELRAESTPVVRKVAEEFQADDPKLTRREAMYMAMHAVYGTPINFSAFEGLESGAALGAAAARFATGDSGKGGK